MLRRLIRHRSSVVRRSGEERKKRGKSEQLYGDKSRRFTSSPTSNIYISGRTEEIRDRDLKKMSSLRLIRHHSLSVVRRCGERGVLVRFGDEIDLDVSPFHRFTVSPLTI